MCPWCKWPCDPQGPDAEGAMRCLHCEQPVVLLGKLAIARREPDGGGEATTEECGGQNRPPRGGYF